MVEWNEQCVIQAPIERIWSLFSDEQLLNILPNLIKHELLTGRFDQVGSTYAQETRIKGRSVAYVMKITAYSDLPDYKQKELFFVPAGLFNITLHFELKKLSDSQNLFVYRGSTRGAHVFGRALLKLDSQNSSEQEVKDLMERVKRVAES